MAFTGGAKPGYTEIPLKPLPDRMHILIQIHHAVHISLHVTSQLYHALT